VTSLRTSALEATRFTTVVENQHLRPMLCNFNSIFSSGLIQNVQAVVSLAILQSDLKNPRLVESFIILNEETFNKLFPCHLRQLF